MAVNLAARRVMEKSGLRFVRTFHLTVTTVSQAPSTERPSTRWTERLSRRSMSTEMTTENSTDSGPRTGLSVTDRIFAYLL